MDSQKTFGEIFSREEADKLFGPVKESVKFKLGEFKEIIAKTTDYIMFRFEPGKLYIFNRKRGLIYSNAGDPKFGPEVVFKIYSMSVLEKLLGSAGNTETDDDPIVEVEQREEVTTVSTPVQTMEIGSDCPPNCPD